MNLHRHQWKTQRLGSGRTVRVCVHCCRAQYRRNHGVVWRRIPDHSKLFDFATELYRTQMFS